MRDCLYLYSLGDHPRGSVLGVLLWIGRDLVYLGRDSDFCKNNPELCGDFGATVCDFVREKLNSYKTNECSDGDGVAFNLAFSL